MAKSRQSSNQKWEAELAMVSLSGVRLLVQDTIAPLTSAEDTYEVTRADTRRVVLFHSSTDANDIRVELEATADATKLPVAPGVYFVLEAVKGEVIHVFNTTGSTITVNIAEIR